MTLSGRTDKKYISYSASDFLYVAQNWITSSVWRTTKPDGAGLARQEATAVGSQPLDPAWHLVHRPEVVLDGGLHEIAHVLARNASCNRKIAHRVALEAVRA